MVHIERLPLLHGSTAIFVAGATVVEAAIAETEVAEVAVVGSEEDSRELTAELGSRQVESGVPQVLRVWALVAGHFLQLQALEAEVAQREHLSPPTGDERAPW